MRTKYYLAIRVSSVNDIIEFEDEAALCNTICDIYEIDAECSFDIEMSLAYEVE